jgi:tRNA (adenine57-N1/adenine58-N1)-methyltransferase
MTAPAPATVARGDRVVLVEPETGFVHLVHCDGKGTRKQRGLGVLDPDRLVGVAFGDVVQAGAKRVAVVPPSLPDLAATLARKAQIITPKDASRIVYELGVGAGDRVFESGIGSGAATVALAWAAGAEGEVVVQELRTAFAEFGLENVQHAGLGDRVDVAVGDSTEGLAPGVHGPFSAALLDLPEPWKVLPHLVGHLAAGARVACYTPQVSQMEEAVRTLLRLGLVQVRAIELIERAWEVKERGSRPSFEGLGHTGFLVFARWLGRPAGPPPQAAPASGPES